MWIFEPHVAEQIYRGPRRRARRSPSSATPGSTAKTASRMDGNRIIAITTLDGRTFRGQMFIDATYEGDLHGRRRRLVPRRPRGEFATTARR